MSNVELEILKYLESSYCAARTTCDSSAMIRISRAIAAFKSDPVDAPEAVFARKFVDNYHLHDFAIDNNGVCWHGSEQYEDYMK